MQPTQSLQIDVEALRALLVVIEQGSITRAAQILHLSRSAVSWRMKRLEEHVGQELIIRDGHDLRPSRAARAILEDARALVETHDRIARKLAGDELTGEVTVGADVDVDVPCLTRVLGSFRRVHPAVEVNLVLDRTWNIQAGLDVGDIDLAIIQVEDDVLVAEDRVLWSDSLVWVTGRSTPHDDGVVPLVTYGLECPWRALSEPMLRAGGLDHRVALSVPSTDAVVSAVEDGLGVGVIPRRYVTDRLRLWDSDLDLGTFPGVHGVVRSGASDPSPTVEELAELITVELCIGAGGLGAAA